MRQAEPAGDPQRGLGDGAGGVGGEVFGRGDPGRQRRRGSPGSSPQARATSRSTVRAASSWICMEPIACWMCSWPEIGAPSEGGTRLWA